MKPINCKPMSVTWNLMGDTRPEVKQYLGMSLHEIYFCGMKARNFSWKVDLSNPIEKS